MIKINEAFFKTCKSITLHVTTHAWVGYTRLVYIALGLHHAFLIDGRGENRLQ